MLKQTILIGVSILFIACSASEPKITEIDPKDVIHLEDRYDTHDMQLQSTNMVQSLLREKFITNRPRAPRIMLGEVQIDDSVDEYIDVRLVQETIQHNLIKSKMANFVDNINIKALERQIDYQNDSQYINKKTASTKGNFIAAEYMLSGRLSKIIASNSKIKNVTYKLVMKLTNISTDIIAWQEIDTVVKRIK